MDEFLAIYAEGPEAVYRELEELYKQFFALKQKVDELSARINKDSHNSNKPPSSDSFKKPPKPQNLRGKTDKRSGGQKGHDGCTLKRVEEPDHTVTLTPGKCACCSGSLSGAEEVLAETRQVFDLPPIKLEVTEYVSYARQCSKCGVWSQAQFPEGVTQPAQYGPRYLGMLTYLNQYQLIPVARTQECAADMFGHQPSQGTILNAVATCAMRLEPVQTVMKSAAKLSKVLRKDETGTRVGKKTGWVHTASTPELTCYFYNSRRGRAAHKEIGILSEFTGTVVHDCLSSYMDAGYKFSHALCNAHILRELLGQWEDTRQTWTQRMSSVLRSLKRAKEQAQAKGDNELEEKLLQRYQRVYKRIVERALIKNPAPPPTGKPGRSPEGKTRSLALRLQRYEPAVLQFAVDFDVPFDNNLAERDLRMIKLQKKISGCFRSEQGAINFCTTRSYISTMRKQGQNVMKAICSVFQGRIIMPQFKTAKTN